MLSYRSTWSFKHCTKEPVLRQSRRRSPWGESTTSSNIGNYKSTVTHTVHTLVTHILSFTRFAHPHSPISHIQFFTLYSTVPPTQTDTQKQNTLHRITSSLNIKLILCFLYLSDFLGKMPLFLINLLKTFHWNIFAAVLSSSVISDWHWRSVFLYFCVCKFKLMPRFLILCACLWSLWKTNNNLESPVSPGLRRSSKRVRISVVVRATVLGYPQAWNMLCNRSIRKLTRWHTAIPFQG